MHPNTQDLFNLFDGLRSAHGTYKISGKTNNRGKAQGSAVTLQEEVTVDLWAAHLSGISGLGIVPINKDGHCRFGAIDVDKYDIDLKALNTQLQIKRLPLVLCRTKSGGAHLYLFTHEMVEAELMVSRLKEMAVILGMGNCEIFPKQTQLLVERGDVGSWINMPYFGGDETTRFAYDESGIKLSVEEFIRYAASRALMREQLASLSFEPESFLPDGPPCLNTLARQGFPEGTRNNGLFNMAIYAKKAWPDDWRLKLEDLNTRYMRPPLTATEVIGVIRSMDKHEYNYTCKTAPLEQFCNRDRCVNCKFGVGKGDFGLPKFGTLTKLMTSPPIWFLDIEGGHRLELTTEELQSPILFQRRCMEVLTIVPGIPKREDWTDILHMLFENVNTVDVPKEATPRGQLVHMFTEFATSRVQAKSRDEILLGKPFNNNGKTFFRMCDFVRFLDRQRFNMFTLGEITAILRDEFELTAYVVKVNGKSVSCMRSQSPERIELDAETLPKMPVDEESV